MVRGDLLGHVVHKGTDVDTAHVNLAHPNVEVDFHILRTDYAPVSGMLHDLFCYDFRENQERY
jgi:hypothetical protein